MHQCHLCGSHDCRAVPHFQELHRVTSDCKPWPSGGQLFLCAACGTVQKNTDSVWLKEIGRIYADYTIYHQSQGSEQSVFNQDDGGMAARSVQLLTKLQQAFELPDQGRLLDVGCGNGALLSQFSRLRPHWTAIGTEFNQKYVAEVERIPGVESVHTGPLEELEGSFDLATMVHVLEHIPGPGGVLDCLLARLNPGGHLLIDLPDHQLNPYDLVIADHCSHFSAQSLTTLLNRHRFQVQTMSSEWVPKERVTLARAGPLLDTGVPDRLNAAGLALERSVQHLRAVLTTARARLVQGALGVFGTSIGAAWLFGSLEGQVQFFVDEDPSRVGRDFLGRPVYAPSALPQGSQVLIALAPVLADRLLLKFRATVPQVSWWVGGQR